MKTLRLLYLEIFHPGMGWLSRQPWWVKPAAFLPLGLLSGCLTSKNFEGVVSQLAKDTNSISITIKINTIYGTGSLEFTRNVKNTVPLGVQGDANMDILLTPGGAMIKPK